MVATHAHVVGYGYVDPFVDDSRLWDSEALDRFWTGFGQVLDGAENFDPEKRNEAGKVDK